MSLDYSVFIYLVYYTFHNLPGTHETNANLPTRPLYQFGHIEYRAHC
jgi:hypothetical protein